jgi:hypothetical protein
MIPPLVVNTTYLIEKKNETNVLITFLELTQIDVKVANCLSTFQYV